MTGRANQKPKGAISVLDSFWRTLIRVVTIQGTTCWVVLPGWCTTVTVPIKIDTLPDNIQAIIAPGVRLHAHVNIGVDSMNQLQFRDWEEQ